MPSVWRPRSPKKPRESAGYAVLDRERYPDLVAALRQAGVDVRVADELAEAARWHARARTDYRQVG